MFVAGDRLLGVNGQCVRTVSEAEGLLGGSEEVVRLHLQRHESLPRPGLEPAVTMGSNISRHSGKGLTGRRTQSSGNLCNGKAPGVHRSVTTKQNHVSKHFLKNSLYLCHSKLLDPLQHSVTQNIINIILAQLRNTEIDLMPYGPGPVRGHKVASTWGFEKNPLFLSTAL